MSDTAERLDGLLADIDAAATRRDAAGVAAGWRAVLDDFVGESAGRKDPEPDDDDKDYCKLWDAARRAMANLGGQAEPAIQTLADYDSDQYGPMLGVSDEGSATAAIRHGALASPKCVALTDHTPLTVGVAHDAERLGAVGEVVVGPDEYAAIRLACRGRLLTTTNVGTRVNVRLFLEAPVIRLTANGVDRAIERLSDLFRPFVKTASGRSRLLTVFIHFDRSVSARQQGAALARLQAAVAGGKFCRPKWHRLGLLANPGSKTGAVVRVRAVIDLAAAAGLCDVAVPGIYDRFDPSELDEILRYAAEHGVRVGPLARADPQTTARHVWTGLATARNMGLELGKYGLVPLTFDEQKEVIARIQYWFPYWCAAPVYYVDYPLVTAREVYHGPRLAAGIRRWLTMVARLGVRVVLVDTAKKSEGGRLLKESAGDPKGFLTAAQVAGLTGFARKLGVKVLWAGGITLAQAYTLGRLGVFGVYVTSAAAAVEPVDRHYRRDPFLTASREPRPEAVARVKLLLEAGFLVGRGAAHLAEGAEALLAALAAGEEKKADRRQAALHPDVVQAWRDHLAAGDRSNAESS